MKKSIRVAIPLALILVVFLGFVACEKETSKPPTTDTTRVQEDSEADWDRLNGTDPCKGKDMAENLGLLKTKYHNKSVDTGDENLNAQRQNSKYDIVIDSDPTWGIVMRIKGRIALDGRPRKLSNLMKFIEKDLEKGCVQRVTFEPMTASAASFEWIICEDPARPCPPPDGACGMCMLATPTPDANANSNGNRNPNPNANTPANPNPIGSPGTNSRE